MRKRGFLKRMGATILGALGLSALVKAAPERVEPLGIVIKACDVAEGERIAWKMVNGLIGRQTFVNGKSFTPRRVERASTEDWEGHVWVMFRMYGDA